MPQPLRPCALALLLALPVSAAGADVPWRFLPQLPVYSEALPVFVDLDGDGVNEIVFGARVEDPTGWSAAYALGVLAQDGGGPLHLVESVALPHTLLTLVTAQPPGQAGSVLVTVTLSGETRLMEFTGRDLQLVRDILVPSGTRLEAVVDIDADGNLEILGDTTAGAGFGVPQILDYATGLVEWQGTDSTQGVVAAQLDADPALEIISRGSVGRVYDGATRLQEWAWPAGFGQAVVSGRFELDPQVPGFVTRDFNGTTVFRASPYSPLRDFPGLQRPLTVFDVDRDGCDELYATGANGSDFVRVSAQDGSVQSLFGPLSIAAPPRLGRLRPDGAAVAALPSGSGFQSSPGDLLMFDLDATQVIYDADYAKAPWWPSAFVRPQPAGPLLAASLVGRYPPGAQQYQIELQLRDATTGEPGPLRSNLFPHASFSAYATLMSADLDGVPGDEIVVLRTANFAAAAAVLDGTTLQDRWRVLGAGSPLADVRVRGWALVDYNQDGAKDVVLATSSAFGNGVRLKVLSGTDGALLWQSVSIADSNTSDRVGLVAGEIDAQPGSEIVLAVNNAVYAFDTQSGLATWNVKAAIGDVFTDVVHWGSGSTCRIGVLVLGGRLRTLSCTDRELISIINLPPGTERVAPLDAEGRVLAATTDEGDLFVSRDGGFFQPELTGLGTQLSLNWPWAVQSSPGSVSALLGSGLQLMRVDLQVEDRLFSSGFELPP